MSPASSEGACREGHHQGRGGGGMDGQGDGQIRDDGPMEDGGPTRDG